MRVFEGLALIEKRQPRSSPRLHTGAGSLAGLPEIAAKLGTGTVWLVTDPGLMEHGYPAHTQRLLESAGFRVILLTDVQENPDSLVVRRLADRLVLEKPNLIKVVNMLGQEVDEYTNGIYLFYYDDGSIVKQYFKN